MMFLQEEKQVNEESTRGNMDLLVLGRVLLSSVDTLSSSSVIYYNTQAGAVLVLHVASITGVVILDFNTLTHIQRSTAAHTHTHL